MSALAHDLTGQRFHMLVASVRDGMASPVRWVCRCDCGNEVSVRAKDLRSGTTKSCGCYRQSRMQTLGLKHGHAASRSPTYASWQAMRERCENSHNAAYNKYGGRGIKVCERWLTFENFLADMGERPKGTSIDRFPNRDGDYEPGNCRWATATEQSRNRHSSKLTADDVQEIHRRCEHGESQQSVARRFDVTRSTVADIRQGRVWRDQSRPIADVDFEIP